MPDCPDIFSFDYTTVSANFASPPLIFTRVCHLWRVAACSTTGIWSRIKVTLSGGDEPLKSFLPCLLQHWLALSGSQPLTIHINQLYIPLICHCSYRSASAMPCKTRPRSPTLADFTLLYILYSESRRWETLICSGSREDEWFIRNLDTPQLRTLECAWSDVARFNAPSLHRLDIDQWLPDLSPIPTCKNVRHLHLSSASPQTIRSTSVTFPLLETIKVDQLAYSGAGSHSVTHSCLESITLPLLPDATRRHWFIEIFAEAHLPKLQKLILGGHLKKSQVDLVTDALAVASCNVQAVDFRAYITQDGVDMDVVELLLSVVKEVSLQGKVLRSRAPCN